MLQPRQKTTSEKVNRTCKQVYHTDKIMNERLLRASKSKGLKVSLISLVAVDDYLSKHNF